MADKKKKPVNTSDIPYNNTGDNSHFEKLGDSHEKTLKYSVSTRRIRERQDRLDKAQDELNALADEERQLKSQIQQIKARVQQGVYQEYKPLLQNAPNPAVKSIIRHNRDERVNQLSMSQTLPLQERLTNIAETMPNAIASRREASAAFKHELHEGIQTAQQKSMINIDSRLSDRAIASDINKVKNTTQYMGAIERYARQPTHQLEQTSEQLRNNLYAKGKEAKELIQRNDVDGLNKLHKEEQKERTRLGIIEGAISEQKSRGGDTKSLVREAREDQVRYKRMERAINRPEEIDEAAKGMAGLDHATAMKQALEEFKNALTAASNTTKDFEKNIRKKDLTEEQRTKLIADKTAAEKRVVDADTKLVAAKKIEDEVMEGKEVNQRALRGIGRGLHGIAGGLQYIGIDRQREVLGLETAFANNATDIYRDHMSAAKNMDYRAYRRVTEYEGEAQAHADYSRWWGGAAGVFKTVGHGFDAGSDVVAARDRATKLESYSSVTGAMANLYAQPVLQLGAAGEAVPEVVNGLMEADRLLTGRTTGTAAIQVHDAHMQALQAKDEITNTQRQSLLDHTRNITMGTIGMGSSGEGVYNYLQNKDNLMKLGGEDGLGSSDIARLTAMGSQTLGANFDVKDLHKAGQAQLKGLMSSDQYIGALGQLQNAGGTSGDLETIMRDAVAAGLNDSKSIMAVVAGISEMSNSLVKSGSALALEGFKGSAAIAMHAASADGANTQIASQRALDAMNLIKEQSGSNAFDMYNVIEMDAIQRAAQENNISLSGSQASAALTLTAQETNELDERVNSGDGASVSEFLNKTLGTDKNMAPEAAMDFAKKIAKANRSSTMNKFVGAHGNDVDLQKQLQADIDAGVDVTKSGKYDSIINPAARRAGVDADTFVKTLQNTKVPPEEKKKMLEQSGKNEAARKNISTSGGLADAKELNSAFSGLKGSIDDLVTEMKKNVEKMSPEQMAANQKKNAEDYKFPTESITKFSNSVNVFGEIMDVMKTFVKDIQNKKSIDPADINFDVIKRMKNINAPEAE